MAQQRKETKFTFPKAGIISQYLIDCVAAVGTGKLTIRAYNFRISTKNKHTHTTPILVPEVHSRSKSVLIRCPYVI